MHNKEEDHISVLIFDTQLFSKKGYIKLILLYSGTNSERKLLNKYVAQAVLTE